MIKAVIFDFFGVICSDGYWKSVKKGFSRPEKFGELSHEASRGVLSWQQFLSKLSNETGRSGEELEALFEKEQINPELLSYINDLHNKYQTALLTNASHEYIKSLTDKVELSDIFDEIIISSEIGLAKPDPKIYHYALEKLNVKPGESVFVDDTVKHIDAAKNIGINSILYQDFPQFKKKLEVILASSDN